MANAPGGGSLSWGYMSPKQGALGYKAPMPEKTYLRFAIANARFVGFGFLIAFASSFGQTYFIGIFGPSIAGEFDLSHTAWATTYLCGTIASALVLPFSGKLIDHYPLRAYTLGALSLLTLGALAMSSVQGVVLLAVAIFMIRQAGQGLMSHISITSMARYFEEGRGRAIALATLGFAAGEAILPRSALSLIAWLGWRGSFLAVIVFLVGVVLPVVMWLLKGHEQRHAAHLEKLGSQDKDAGGAIRSWTRGEVLRDPRFYLLLPGLLSPAMIITALFFNHLFLADAKSWSHTHIADSYVIYAGATTVIALVCGPLIDRLGGMRLVPAMLLPMAGGLLVAGTMRQTWSVWPYFVLLGCSVGVSHTAVSALWAELYGVGSIGAIKSVVSALAVLSSALGPVIMGACMDAGISIETVCIGFAGYALFASILLFAGTRLRAPVLP